MLPDTAESEYKATARNIRHALLNEQGLRSNEGRAFSRIVGATVAPLTPLDAKPRGACHAGENCPKSPSLVGVASIVGGCRLAACPSTPYYPAGGVVCHPPKIVRKCNGPKGIERGAETPHGGPLAQGIAG